MSSKLIDIIDEISEREHLGLGMTQFTKDGIEAIERQFVLDGDVEKAMSELQDVLSYKWKKLAGEIHDKFKESLKLENDESIPGSERKVLKRSDEAGESGFGIRMK